MVMRILHGFNVFGEISWDVRCRWGNSMRERPRLHRSMLMCGAGWWCSNLLVQAMTSRVLSLLCFLVVSLGSTIQADDVDEQRFLKEVLPVWEEFTRWKGLEWGKMSWVASVPSGEIYRASIEHIKGYYVFERIALDGTKTYFILNPSYAATIKIIDDVPRVYSITQKGSANWESVLVPREVPYHITSKHGDEAFPDAIKDGSISIVELELKGTNRIAKVSRTGEQQNFSSSELKFSDSVPNMPVALTNYFLNGDNEGQHVVCSGFETIGEYQVPRKLEIKMFVKGKVLPDSTITTNLEWDLDFQLDTSKCFCEHYGIAEPEYVVANNPKKSRIFLAVGIGLLLVSLLVLFRKWRHE